MIMPTLPMNDPILRSIFVGVATGSRGAYLLDLVRKHAPHQFRPVALVDASVDLARTEAARLEWSDMPCFDSLAAAIEAVPADAAIITTPARFHGEQIRLALTHGLHVLVAKPMTYDLRTAEDLVHLAENNGRCLVVDQQQQFKPTERALAEWIQSKKYGEVGYVQFTQHRHRPQMRAFTGNDPFVWEQGVHSFNSLIALLGTPAIRVTAHHVRPPWTNYNGPTMVSATLEFPGNVLCAYMGSFESHSNWFELRVECRDAALRVIGDAVTPNRLEVVQNGGRFECSGIDDTQADRPDELNSIEALHKGATCGSRVVNDGRDNLRTLAVVDAFIRSATSGKSEPVRQF